MKSVCLSFCILTILAVVASTAVNASHPSTPHASTSPLAPAFEPLPYGFNVTQQPLTLLSGSVPTWLKGSLYRNGPAYYPSESNPHWFDGFAFIHAYHFNGADSPVLMSASFVGSTPYNQSKPDNAEPAVPNQEQASGFPYAANTAVTIQEMGGMLITSTAFALSNAFDPVTTANVADPVNFSDELIFEVGPEHRVVDINGDIYHFSYAVIAPYGYEIYKIAAGTTTRTLVGFVNATYGLNYQHSFSVTDSYIVLVDQPVPLPSDFKWDSFILTPNTPTFFRIISKSTGAEVATSQTDGFFSFHQIHAYEQTGSIVLDVIQYPNATMFQLFYLDQILNNTEAVGAMMNTALPTRYIIITPDPTSSLSGNTQQVPYVQGTPLASFGIEMPSINLAFCKNGPYRIVYAIALTPGGPNTLYNAIVKLNVVMGEQTYWSDSGALPTEPLFVAAPNGQNEDDGVLLSVVTNPFTQSSFLLILDASNMQELARLGLPFMVPSGFHGLFSHEYGFRPAPEAVATE